jgi:hypothetical protein
LFITDQDNNCIRVVNLKRAEVSTYAGICGKSGFKDGPIGTNLFNKPTQLGVDDDGYLYVYDSGNRYVRVIKPNQEVYTLINGACFEYTMLPSHINAYEYKNKYLLCLR